MSLLDLHYRNLPRKAFVCCVLPPCRLHEWNPYAKQIADYLHRILNVVKAQFPAERKLPSVVTLAKHFGCSECDILEALRCLEIDGKPVLVNKISTPIAL